MKKSQTQRSGSSQKRASRSSASRATPASRGAGKSKPPAAQRDAIALLEADHVEARTLLEQLSESRESAPARRQTILAKVARALWTHMAIEEDIFYPAFDEAGRSADDEVRGLEAHAEHQSAKDVLEKLERCDPATTEFRALAKVLYDLVDHHAEEEEGEMFPRAKTLLGKERLMELGAELESAKKQRMNGAAARTDAPSSRSRANDAPMLDMH